MIVVSSSGLTAIHAKDGSIKYVRPLCHLKEIENGMHVPSRKIVVFGAKDLPKTRLSDHREKTFDRLMQEREERQKIEENENLDKVGLRKLYTQNG